MIQRLEAPRVEPITLEEAKLFLRIDHAEEDDLLHDLIKAAREHVENETYLYAATQVLSMQVLLHLASWERVHHAFLYVTPVQEVLSVECIDKFGRAKPLEADRWQWVPREWGGYVRTHFVKERAVQLKVLVGYVADQLPVALKSQIMNRMLVLYERRGEARAECSLSFPRRISL